MSLRQKMSGIRQRLRPRKTPYQPRLAATDFPATVEDVLAAFNTRFACSPAQLQEKIASVAAHAPQWQERTLQHVQQWRSEGLPVYASRGTPLDDHFDWRGPEPFASHDDLYRLRAHRFAFAPQSALACHYDANLLPWFDGVIRHWINAVEDSEAPWAYRSSLVAIQRLLSLSWTLAIIDSHADARANSISATLLRMIYGDLHYLSGVAGDSVANNHLLADRFALWFAKHLFPDLVPGLESEDVLEQAWLEEFERQTYTSGGGFEHSLHYHEFDTELALLYFLLKKRAGTGTSATNAITDTFTEPLRHAVALQAQLGSAQYPVMAFGNATEDPMLPLDPSFRWARNAWTDVYSWLDLVINGRGENGGTACQGESAYWLIPEPGLPAPAGEPGLAPAPWMPHRFPEAGIYCFDHETSAAHIVFRSGPRADTATFFGHTHADLNSVCAVVNGTNLLVDGGTCTYRRGTDIEPFSGVDWRHYFAGPRAHNGLVLEDLSPLGEFKGSFRPFQNSAHAEITLDLNDEGFAITEARIICDNAYNGCRRGVIHAQGQFTVIYDVLTAQALSHNPHFHFQSGGDVSVKCSDTRIELQHSSGATLQLCPSAGLDQPLILEGSSEPTGGWISNSYGKLVAAPQLSLSPGASATNCHAFLLIPGATTRGTVSIEESASGTLTCCVHFGEDVHEIVIPVPESV